MRAQSRGAGWGVLAAVLLGGLAGAGEPTADPAAEREWHSLMEFQLAGDWARVVNSQLPVSNPHSITPVLTLTYYGTPLVNDPATPLALLTFLQHPDRISVFGADTFRLSSGNTTLPFGGVAAEVYPWRAVGVVGDATIRPSHAYVDTDYSLGFSDYIEPTIRMDFAYAGTRNQQGASFLESASPPTNGVYAATRRVDSARLKLATLLVHRTTLLEVKAQVGGSSGYYQAVTTDGNQQSFDFAGTVFSVSLAYTRYLGRNLSVSLTAGYRGEEATETNMFYGVGRGRSTENPFGSAAAQYFLSDSVFLRAGYEFDWSHLTVGAQFTQVTYQHLPTVVLGGRY